MVIQVVSLQVFDSESEPYLYVTDSISLSGMPLIGNEVTANEYLEYAKEDLDSDTSRGIINAMSNAKRALHLAIDSTLNAYGLLERSRRASFPQKLKLLDAAGLFSLSILNTLNIERNAMEHEYRSPTRVRVGEVVDVTRLLLLATERMRQIVVYECLAGWRATDTHGIVQLNPFRGTLSFFRVFGENVRIIGAGESSGAFLLPIRTTTGALIAGVSIDTVPVWSVKLGLSNLDEWPPLLKPVIAQAEAFHTNTFTTPVVYENTVRLGAYIHLPRVQDPEALEQFLDGTGRRVHDFSGFTFQSVEDSR